MAWPYADPRLTKRLARTWVRKLKTFAVVFGSDTEQHNWEANRNPSRM